MCRGKYCTAQHMVANLWLRCHLTCGGERSSGGLLPLEIWPSPERLEAPRLLSIVHPRETISRLGPRSWKTLTSLGALSLCAFIFAFAGEEAQAQQQHAVTDRQVTEVATEIPLKTSPSKKRYRKKHGR